MLDYQKESCLSCKEDTVIYHQYIGDACCESCGKWQNDDDFSDREVDICD